MAITSITTDVAGQIGVAPRLVRIVSTDSFGTVTTAGYLNNEVLQGFVINPTDFIFMNYASGTFGIFTPTISNGVITLAEYVGQGNVTLPTVAGSIAVFANTAGTIETAPNNSTVAGSVTSATPGTVRALIGAMTTTATTMTSGNLVGVRGSVTAVGASGGFLYGAQGKVIATGTLSGSSWTAGLFGQFDISSATVNAGQLAAIWGDWGTTGATATDLTGCRGFAFTNTTANVLNAQDYRYGNATYLLELAGAGGTLTYYKAAGTSAGSAGDASHCAAQQVIAIEINGVAAYIPVFTQNT